MITSNGGPTERIRVTEVRSDRSVEREDEAAAEEPLEIRVVPGEGTAPASIKSR